MQILVRKYIKNGDKDNRKVNTIEEALKSLSKGYKDIYLMTEFLNYVDLFFIGTNNYLRIIN
jgi:hypothetical protein